MGNVNRERPYFVGNWKMNKAFSDLEQFITSIKSADCNQWIAPQTVQLHSMKEMTKNHGPLKIGSQNHSHELSGAFTGETSIEQIQELNLDFAIVGHSERRQLFNETDETINKKLRLSCERQINTILCLGETLDQREENITFDVIANQIKKALLNVTSEMFSQVLIAYEPVWAIGTGKTATPSQAQEVHEYIRSTMRELYGDVSNNTPILYGGSVKPSNARELMGMKDIDGALIGGASLASNDYNAICKNGL